MGSACRNYLILNLILPDTREYRIGRYERMRRSYLKEYRKTLYNNRMLEGMTEALKEADRMEWVRCMNNIQNRAEEIVLHELVYGL